MTKRRIRCRRRGQFIRTLLAMNRLLERLYDVVSTHGVKDHSPLLLSNLAPVLWIDHHHTRAQRKTAKFQAFLRHNSIVADINP